MKVLQGPRQSVGNASSGACRIFCPSHLLGVAACAAWLKGIDGFDNVLADADARMQTLGVVRRAEA